MPVGRRTLLGAACALAVAPRVSFAALPGRSDRRFVLVILRGAMDGLGAVPPYADPDYAAAHGALALAAPGTTDGCLKLDERFGLHPALAPIHPLFAAGEMAVVHAMASPYRERSHFDAQNLLENGTERPGGAKDGWMNRALSALGAQLWPAIAFGPSLPLVVQGPVQVANWKPAQEQGATPGLLLAAARMYAADKALSAALEEGLRTEDMVEGAIGGSARRAGLQFPAVAGAAGQILAAPGGPNLAVMDIGGWDTHVGQGAARGRLAGALGQFAKGMEALRASLGARWKDTAIVAVTEFGRTVGANGTGGTDHGTATAGFLLGGAVQGGRVIADWPGLSTGALYQGRDLAPTTDIRSFLKGVLDGHLRMTARDLATRVFPGSTRARPLVGLIRI